MTHRHALYDRPQPPLRDASSDARRRCFLHAFSVLALGLLSVFALLHFEAGRTGTAAALGLVAAAITLNQLALLRWGNLALAESAALALLYVVLIFALYANVDRAGAYWFAVFPAAALALKGLRRGLIWCAVLLATVGLLWLLHIGGWAPEALAPPALIVMLCSLGALTLVVASLQAALARAERRAEELTQRLSEEALARQSAEHELRSAQARLDFLAQHDHLTRLPACPLLYDRLDQALALIDRRQQRLALLLLDFDRFGELNRRLGQEVGDQVLRMAARRINTVLRRSDTVARVGGDQFAVLLMDVNTEGSATGVAEKLHVHLERPYRIGERELHLRVASGLAFAPADGGDRPALLDIAQRRLHEVKLQRYAPQLEIAGPDGPAASQARERLN